MTSISTEAKVGLFVLAGIIILAFMSFQVSQPGFGLKRGYTIKVVFENAAGLDKDASIQVAGVEVGRVESIALEEGKALITLRIKSDVKLPKDVTASIRTHGLLGDKYVELSAGTKGNGNLEEGEQIAYVERQADVDKLIHQISGISEDIRGVTTTLNKVLGGKAGEEAVGDIVGSIRQLAVNLNAVVKNNERTLHAMLENGRMLSENLNKVVTQNDQKIAQVVENLQSASKEMEKTFASLSEVTEGIKKGEGTVGKLLKDDEMADRLNKTVASLQDVSDKLSQGKGTLGKLINEDETVTNLNTGLTGINRYLAKQEQYRTHLGYRGEYLFESNNWKSYVDLRIQPREDYFYILGLVADPRGRKYIRDYTVNGVTSRVEEWDKNGLLFNAQVAKRYRDVVLRGGIFESTGGAGLDYLAFNDRLKLTFEAFDFTDDNRRAHLKGYGEWRLLKYLYLTAGWDDFINSDNRSPFVGFSIRFEDDDLKYLMTSAPIPK
ncbi:MAG: MCE family protein [Syntrophaceae bacterium]|nr:MCE family protein [Syntrophaceae bacterium]